MSGSSSLFLATERCFREECSCCTSVQSWYSINTDDVQLGILGNREPGEGEESLSERRELIIGRTSEVSKGSTGVAAGILHQ